MVAVLEATCLDSDPHDSFILVCRAMKPSVVIPELMIQWLHNGSMRAGNVSVSDNGTYVVNTLNVSNAQVSDAGLYQCVARIVIPDSSTVTTNVSSTVSSRGELWIYRTKGLSSREAARGHATNVDGIVLSVTINRLYNY